MTPADFGNVVGRISFFVNAGLRFITEICKMRAFAELWDEITRERYGVTDAKHRLFRYGVQVNSLGLTEPQPENNVYRILIEMLAVTLSKNARARAVQLPAWNEALGLPRPWDQQWSLRMQQILAYETDLLEYGDIFDGSTVIDAKVDELKAEAKAELATHRRHGRRRGRHRLHEAARSSRATPSGCAASRPGEQIVVGVNTLDRDRAVAAVGRRRRDHGRRSRRSRSRADRAPEGLARSARRQGGRRPRSPSWSARPRRAATSWSRRSPAPRPASPPASGATTLRKVFGEYRAPTGVAQAAVAREPAPGSRASRNEVEAVSAKLGRRIKFLVGKPGLDGHSNGAEQIAVRARDCGMEVVYEGIRLTPAQIVRAARRRERRTSSACRSCRAATCRWSPRSWSACARKGLDDVPVVVGGIIPPEDARHAQGASASPRSTRPRTSSSTTSWPTS